MLQAIKTSFSPEGDRKKVVIQVECAQQAFNMAIKVWKEIDEAHCVTLDRFRNGSFVTRVMSKQKMIFKIQHTAS